MHVHSVYVPVAIRVDGLQKGRGGSIPLLRERNSDKRQRRQAWKSNRADNDGDDVSRTDAGDV